MYEINYIKMFAIIIKQESLRMFLRIVTILGMIILQIDIFGAYLKNPPR